VKIIVDANIVYSAILNSNGKIGDLLINSQKYFKFISPEFLRHEIRSKYEKIARASGMSIESVMETEYLVCKDINFISEEQINEEFWHEAFELVEDIDIKDIQYVAFAKQFKCKIWSGDKKLVVGLKNKGFEKTLTTNDLIEIIAKK
jgi:predicted nucleic acid-binding protein